MDFLCTEILSAMKMWMKVTVVLGTLEAIPR